MTIEILTPVTTDQNAQPQIQNAEKSVPITTEIELQLQEVFDITQHLS